MATTYDKIATTTLGSSAASITFSSIAASWTDLRVVVSSTTTSAGAQTLLTFNGDTGSNYSFTYLYGSGASAGSSNSTNNNFIWAEIGGNSTTNPHMLTHDIFSYGGSTYKTTLATASEDDNGSGYVSRVVGLWRNTAAITSITLTVSGTTYKIGTTATLYGIKSA